MTSLVRLRLLAGAACLLGASAFVQLAGTTWRGAAAATGRTMTTGGRIIETGSGAASSSAAAAAARGRVATQSATSDADPSTDEGYRELFNKLEYARHREKQSRKRYQLVAAPAWEDLALRMEKVRSRAGGCHTRTRQRQRQRCCGC